MPTEFGEVAYEAFRKHLEDTRPLLKNPRPHWAWIAVNMPAYAEAWRQAGFAAAKAALLGEVVVEPQPCLPDK
jgi:hypothetical protein